MKRQIEVISLIELLNKGRIKSESGQVPEDLTRIISNGAGDVEIICSSNIVLTIHGKILYPNEPIRITHLPDYFRREVNGSGALIIKEGFKYVYALVKYPKE